MERLGAMIRAFLRWLFGGTEPREPYLLRVPAATMRALRAAVQPSSHRYEPLAALLVRFASEHGANVIVAVDVLPFPRHAYVAGPDGANFDTRWFTSLANARLDSNTGLFLSHMHGGRGVPTFSMVDRTTNMEVIAKLAIGFETCPYGAIVLSEDSASAVVTVGGGELVEVDVIVIPEAPRSFVSITA